MDELRRRSTEDLEEERAQMSDPTSPHYQMLSHEIERRRRMEIVKATRKPTAWTVIAAIAALVAAVAAIAGLFVR